MNGVGRRLAALSAALSGGLLLGTSPLAAVPSKPVGDATAALRTDAVYVAAAAHRNVDADAVRRAIGTEPIKIAVIPKIDSVNEVAALPRRMAADLPGNTIAVISGRYFYAGSEVICQGEAGRAAAAAIDANEAALDADNSADSPGDLTKPLIDFVTAVRAAPRCPTEGARADRYADTVSGFEPTATGPDDTASVLPWMLGCIGGGVLIAGALVLVTRRRTRSGARADRERAATLIAELKAELDGLPEGGPGAEARARHGEAEAILAGATTDAQFTAARAAAQEGLDAARAARQGR